MTLLQNPYEIRFRQQMDTYQKDLWKHLERVSQLEPESGDAVLCYLLELACQSQHIGNIELGRKALLELPRDWVLQHIERVAEPLLQLNDEWEYRRLLEVYVTLDRDLAQRLVRWGLKNQNLEIREASEDFLETLSHDEEMNTNIPGMIPMTYRDFYDIPRMFCVRYGGQLYLFDCPFHQEIDSYCAYYTVYALPELTENQLAGSWEQLPQHATAEIGKIGTNLVRFDSSLRQFIHHGVFHMLNIHSNSEDTKG